MLASESTLLRDLKISEGSEEADRASTCLEAASTWIEKYLDRPLAYESEREELLRGHGFPKIQVRLFPIQDVHQVELKRQLDGGWVEVDESDYEVRAERGQLFKPRGWQPHRASRGTYTNTSYGSSGSRNIRVTFDGGYVDFEQVEEDELEEVTVPEDIQEAALFVASTIFQQAGSHGRVRRGHALRAGTWFEQEEYEETIEGLIGHYREF